MPRPALITLNHIREAIEILNVRGQSITTRSLRDVIGFGSFDTICKLRKQLDTEPVAATEQSVQLQRDDDTQELQQAKDDYRELWHEAASDCVILREELELLLKPVRLSRQDKRKTYDVFKLHFEGKTDSEIATQLDLSRSTVWSILNRS